MPRILPLSVSLALLGAVRPAAASSECLVVEAVGVGEVTCVDPSNWQVVSVDQREVSMTFAYPAGAAPHTVGRNDTDEADRAVFALPFRAEVEGVAAYEGTAQVEQLEYDAYDYAVIRPVYQQGSAFFALLIQAYDVTTLPDPAAVPSDDIYTWDGDYTYFAWWDSDAAGNSCYTSAAFPVTLSEPAADPDLCAGAGPADSDGDGVPDDADACPGDSSAELDVDGDGCLDLSVTLSGYVDETCYVPGVGYDTQTVFYEHVVAYRADSAPTYYAPGSSDPYDGFSAYDVTMALYIDGELIRESETGDEGNSGPYALHGNQWWGDYYNNHWYWEGGQQALYQVGVSPYGDDLFCDARDLPDGRLEGDVTGGWINASYERDGLRCQVSANPAFDGAVQITLAGAVPPTDVDCGGADSDGDGVPDEADACPGYDDAANADGDSAPDGCDACPADALNDADGDGSCYSVDPCPLDPLDDIDGDGACADGDPCPLDPDDDIDGDGACGDVDACPDDADNDADGDGVCGDLDECDLGDDADADGDATADACDLCPFDEANDADGDGACGDEDPCPLDPDDDIDGDGACADEDACPEDPDDDIDGDEICGDVDPCPADAENDADGDGICEIDDSCPTVANADQSDADGDGIGDVCEPDNDDDGRVDDDDNCPSDANPDQADRDGDGYGDACDADDDGDGVIDGADTCAGTPAGQPVLTNGCSVAETCPCDNGWKNHGAYVSCTTKAANDLAKLGRISSSQKGAITAAAGASSCGKKK